MKLNRLLLVSLLGVSLTSTSAMAYEPGGRFFSGWPFHHTETDSDHDRDHDRDKEHHDSNHDRDHHECSGGDHSKPQTPPPPPPSK